MKAFKHRLAPAMKPVDPREVVQMNKTLPLPADAFRVGVFVQDEKVRTADSWATLLCARDSLLSQV